MKYALFAACLIAAANAGAVELTKSNFDDKTGGRNAFVKFQAPWWGHCKGMKAAWDKLGDEFADSSSVLIGDADCTASGKDLCEKYEVKGYPTIKYFVDGDTKGADYQGGRDFDSLKKHVVDKLEVKCDVSSPDACDDKEKKYIDKMKSKTAADRAKQLKRLDGMKGNSMKADLKKWLSQRLNILKQLTKDEL